MDSSLFLVFTYLIALAVFKYLLCFDKDIHAFSKVTFFQQHEKKYCCRLRRDSLLFCKTVPRVRELAISNQNYLIKHGLMANLFLFTVALNAVPFQLKLKDRRFSVLIPCSSGAAQASIQCVGICASITQPFCRTLENTTMLDVYPREYKQCAGSTGFMGADVAPDSFCSLGYSRFVPIQLLFQLRKELFDVRTHHFSICIV